MELLRVEHLAGADVGVALAAEVEQLHNHRLDLLLVFALARRLSDRAGGTEIDISNVETFRYSMFVAILHSYVPVGQNVVSYIVQPPLGLRFGKHTLKVCRKIRSVT